jgi:hypothetical protein
LYEPWHLKRAAGFGWPCEVWSLIGATSRRWKVRCSGYHRLRVGAVRIIFRYQPSAAGRPQVLCVFAEHRSMVYLLLEGLLARGLAQADQRKETPP